MWLCLVLSTFRQRSPKFGTNIVPSKCRCPLISHVHLGSLVGSPASRNFLQSGLVVVAVLMSTFRDSVSRIVPVHSFFGKNSAFDYELDNCSAVKRGC